jgi:hypothetical protein
MRGKLSKSRDRWIVEYLIPQPPFVLDLPLLMDESTFPKDRSKFIDGCNVEFKIVEQWEVGNFDMEGMVEYAEIVPEVKVEEPYDYWKERCLAAEKFIDLSPCDLDIYDDQLIAHGEWVTIKNKQTN